MMEFIKQGQQIKQQTIFSTKTRICESTFFPCCMKEWNDLSEKLRRTEPTV